jgi:hypothetical protein
MRDIFVVEIFQTFGECMAPAPGCELGLGYPAIPGI